MNVLRALWNSATFTSWMNIFVQMTGMLVIIPLVWGTWSAVETGTFFLIASVTRFALLFCDRLAGSFAMLISYVASGSDDLHPRTTVKPKHLSDAATPLAEVRPVNMDLFHAVYGTLGTALLGVSISVVLVTALIAMTSLHRLGKDFGGTPVLCYLAMSVALLGLLMRMNLLRYEIVLRGTDRVALVARWNAIMNLGSLLAVIIALLVKCNILVWSLILAFSILASGFRNYLLVRFTPHPVTTAHLPMFRWNREVVRAAWQPTWRGLVSNLSYVGSEELVAMLSPFYLSGLQVNSYLLYNRFYSTVGPIAQIPMTSRLPYMARLVASGQTEILVPFFCKRILICGLLTLIGCNAIGILVPAFAAFSHRSIETIPLWSWSLIVLLFIFERVTSMLNILLEAGNLIVHHWRRIVVALVSMLILPWTLQHFGIAGGFYALLLPRIVLFHGLILRHASNFSSTRIRHLLNWSYIPLVGCQSIILLILGYCLLNGFSPDQVIRDLPEFTWKNIHH